MIPARLRILACILLTTLFVGGVTRAHAQGEEPSNTGEAVEQDMDLRTSITYGFDGIGKPGRWNPVVVRLSNLGDAVHGDIRLRSVQGRRTSEIRHPYEIRRELHVAKGGGQLLRFLLPIGSPALPIQVSIRHEGRIIHEEEIDANARTAPEALVVSLSRRRVLEGLLASSPEPGGKEREEDSKEGGIQFRSSTPVNVAYPLLEFLPEHWAGYHAVDLLFLGSAPLHRLTAPQWRAIEDWIARGGYLIMTEPEAGVPRTDRARRLWDSGVSAEAAGDVLLRRLGTGAIYRLAQDERELGDQALSEGDDTTPAAYRTMRSLARARSGREPRPDIPVLSERAPFSDPINRELLDGPVYSYPSRWLIAVALLAYIASFGAVTRNLAGGNRKLIPALVVVPLLVGAAFYLVLFLANPPPRNALVEIQRITGKAGDPVVSLNRDVMALAAKGYSFALYPPRGSIVVPVEGGEALVNIEREERVIRATLSRWRERHYFLTDRIWTPLRVAHRGGAEGGELALANDSSYPAENVYLIFSERIYDIGSLSSNQVVRRSYDAAQALDWSTVPERRRQVLEQRQAALGPTGGAARSEAILMVITGRIAQTSGADPVFDTEHSVAVVELRIPLDQSESD